MTLLGVAIPHPAAAAPAEAGSPAVGRVTYDLGDQAFVPAPPYRGKNEVAAVVHYPKGQGAKGVARGRHPLIVMQHGLWNTCADRAAQNRMVKARKALAAAEKAGDRAEADRQRRIMGKLGERLSAWPCRPGVAPLPSSSGYDYLAEELARQGFVVVSVGANGINATSSGQADSVYQARADLINKHLGLWRQLDAGKGPLKGKLKDPRTGRTSGVAFAGRVDLGRVGTLGHSMGGGGVMQHASDKRHGAWPAGVKVKAALGLAPTATWENEPVTKVPMAVLWGTCDQVNTGEYVRWNKGRNKRHRCTASPSPAATTTTSTPSGPRAAGRWPVRTTRFPESGAATASPRTARTSSTGGSTRPPSAPSPRATPAPSSAAT
ncbi:alpha/beta hydrolase [Streptomyces spectabilis]|uniref:poly(ethylene terephthalate) hydrolase family protein n=1 Tax=Streptomyces spectabilis TaxID=68270 RepID=UPI0034089079